MTARDTWVKPTADQVIEALSEACALIQDGWTRLQARAVIDGQPCFCIMGAVAEVCGTIRLTHPVMWGTRVEIMGSVVPGAWLRDAVTAALLAVLPPRFGTLAAYNDTPARERHEIVALFNVAISAVRVVAA